MRSLIPKTELSLSLPPIERCLGGRKSQAAKSRFRAKRSPDGADVSGAVAVIGPRPGRAITTSVLFQALQPRWHVLRPRHDNYSGKIANIMASSWHSKHCSQIRGSGPPTLPISGSVWQLL